MKRYIILYGGYDTPTIEGGPFGGRTVEDMVMAQESRLVELLHKQPFGTEYFYLDIHDDGRVELGAYSDEYLDRLDGRDDVDADD